MRHFFSFFILSCCVCTSLLSRQAELDEKVVVKKAQEIMKMHAQHKELSPEITKRLLLGFLTEIDPSKTYLTQQDVPLFTDPSTTYLEKIRLNFYASDFSEFFRVYETLAHSIPRRQEILEQLENAPLRDYVVDPLAFKNQPFPQDLEQLKQRILDYWSLQDRALQNMTPDLKDKTLSRIQKRRQKFEEDILEAQNDPKKTRVFTHILKALASSLDAHTAYLTPEEATQFLINVQQKLFGIGVQLRDDINGFTVVKIIEGGPAHQHKGLKIRDRIIAIDGEPVVGMDLQDAVELIRGETDTPVVITVIRDTSSHQGLVEERLDFTLMRGEVVLKEARYETLSVPFGETDIAILKLHSFYQDQSSSSANDLMDAFTKLKKDRKISGVILDLRTNSGGLLPQAVAVTGLFITKGIVVSIKDEKGKIQHLRDLDGKTMWDGPLIVLIDRLSASASEIVAQTLQDYGRALIVGDDHSFGKGSFQTFTLDALNRALVKDEGEVKVTRGRYYTVSGKTPQLRGVASDILVPSIFSASEIGEQYATYPLDNDSIEENFHDRLDDIPFLERLKYESFYKFNLQKKVDLYAPHLQTLRHNSATRVKHNRNYQNLLTELNERKLYDNEDIQPFGQNDLQLEETISIMQDVILLEEQRVHE